MTLRRTTAGQTGRKHPHFRAEKLNSDNSTPLQRPALVTIQHNIRRNKSRLGFVPDDDQDEDTVSVGTKRKRALAGIENAVAGPSQPRTAKRFKPSSSPVQSDSESDEEAAMETEHGSEIDEEPSSEYLIQWAPRSQLEKLKKPQLISLYEQAGLSRQNPDYEHLTRRALVEALFTSRSRSKRGVSKRAPDGHRRHPRPVAVAHAPFTPDSDDYLSVAKGGHGGRNGLRRSQTEMETSPAKANTPLGRSFSLNTLTKNNKRREKRTHINSNGSTLSDEPPPVTPISPPITRKRVGSDPKNLLFSYSELSEVEEQLPRAYEPSPRRLRSHGDRSAYDSARMGRQLPGRHAKPKIGDLQENDSESDSGGSDNEGVPASSAVDSDREDVSEPEEDEDEEVEESPRKLRNGKVLHADDRGDEDDEEEEAEGSDVSEDVDASVDPEYMEEDEDTEVDGAAVDDAEDSNNDEEEVDLSEETVKTLTRYRRDELVRLCESRNLDAEGTKPQLAKALLEWRDSSQPSSSSASTVRAPSTEHPARRKARPPVLERSGRIHVSQPQTPPLSCNESIDDVEGVVRNDNPDEPEFEFDLETLGLEDKEIPYERLVKREKIGSGGFKDVYSGTLGNRKVAIAEFRGTLTAMDIKELQLLRDLSHENIVRFFGVSVPDNTKETPVMMISELCTNGDLFDYIRNEKAPTLSRVLRLMFDIARGLEYLHKRKPSIIHRDCKSSNILITGKGRAKIADFGLAKVKQSTRSMVRSLVGTVNWQAPELWHAHPKYDHKADVFSCAMVFWEILQWHITNKKYPWEGMNEHAIYEAVGTRRLRPSIGGLRKQWCPEIVDLLERMWAQDPRDRPTMSEVVVELDNMRA